MIINLSVLKMVKIHQHVKFQANPSMHSPANARKPLRTDGRTDGQTDGRTDGQTDRRTCRKTVTVGRVDQRTHVQVKRGYFRLRTDGRTDGQPENIMPPAPKSGGIKKSPNIITSSYFHNCGWCQTLAVSNSLHSHKIQQKWLLVRSFWCRH